MGGRRRWRTVSALMVAVVVVSTGCQSSEAHDRATGGDGTSAESISSSSSLTSLVVPSTTQTTVATTSTESTLAESAQAEAAIEAAIVGWWTFPRDTSLGDAGMPFEFVTGPLFQRLRGIAERRTAAGEIQRSRGRSQVQIVEARIDLDAGSASVDVCTRGDDELVDAATGEVLGADGADAFTGVVTAQRVGDGWRVADFFTTQTSSNPVGCEIE